MKKSIIGSFVLAAFVCFTTFGYAQTTPAAPQASTDKAVTVDKAAPADKATVAKKAEPAKKTTHHKQVKNHKKTAKKETAAAPKPETPAQEKTTK